MQVKILANNIQNKNAKSKRKSQSAKNQNATFGFLFDFVIFICFMFDCGINAKYADFTPYV